MLCAVVVCLHTFLCAIDGLVDIFHHPFESLVVIQATELSYVNMLSFVCPKKIKNRLA
jgi:hypothetical protein